MPQRRCIGCRQSDEQSSLVRLVRRDGVVIEATAPRLDGRGAYLHPECARIVLERKAIPRAFRGAEPSAELGHVLQAMSE